MSAAPKAERSLERAIAAMDTVLQSMIEMRPGGLRRSVARLDEAAEVLRAVLTRGVGADEKIAVLNAARALRSRMDSASALIAAAQRLFGTAEHGFHGYTAEGEGEQFGTPATLLFEL